MIRYIPDELFVDLKNKEKVKKILNDIPDTSLSLATGEESTVK